MDWIGVLAVIALILLLLIFAYIGYLAKNKWKILDESKRIVAYRVLYLYLLIQSIGFLYKNYTNILVWVACLSLIGLWVSAIRDPIPKYQDDAKGLRKTDILFYTWTFICLAYLIALK